MSRTGLKSRSSRAASRRGKWLPITFTWRRIQRAKHGVLWELWHADNCVGRCFTLAAQTAIRAAPLRRSRAVVVLTDYYAGTASAARKALERDWDKRSIGLFGEDDISFEVAPC